MQENIQIQNVPDQYKSVVAEDIEKRKTDSIDINSKFQNILSSKTLQEIQNKGVTQIGNSILTPSLLDNARNDNALKTKLYMDFKNQTEPFVQKENQPVVALSSADYKNVDTSSFDPALTTTDDFQQLIDSVNDRQAVAKIFGKNSLIPLKGKQMIVDMFQTGSLYDELSRVVASIPGDVLRLPNLAWMAQAGTRAAIHGITAKEDGAMGAKFTQLMSNPMLTQYNALLNSNIVTRDAASRVQQWYKDTYTKLYGEEAYKKDHAALSYKVDEQGRIVPEVDENNEFLMKATDLDLGLAHQLLDLSYNKLTGTEKSVMFFSSIAPLTIPSRMLRTSGALKLYEKVEQERKLNPDGTRGLDNYEVLQYIKNKKGNKLWKYWRKGWQALTISGDKNRLVEADNIMEHTNTIAKYDDEIASVTKEVSDLKSQLINKQKKLNVAPLKDKRGLEADVNTIAENYNKKTRLLASIKDGRTTYVRKAGKGLFDNPYLRSVIFDDILISSAMGYGSNILSSIFGGDDEDPSTERWYEMFVGLTAPILVPGLIPFSAKMGTKVANLATGGEGVKDLAMGLQNSKWLPMIKPGDLYNGDEVKFAKIIEEINLKSGKKVLTPTENQLESFRVFSKIFKNMKPHMRDRAYQSILRYNRSMDTFEAEMRLVFKNADGSVNEEMVTEKMGQLQLSMAEVTGLAPLIAYYNKIGNTVTSSGAIKDIDELAAMALAQEDKLDGINNLLQTIKLSIKKQGGADLSTNSELSKTFNRMEKMVAENRSRLDKEKQHLLSGIELFEKDIGLTEIDTDTLNTVVRIKGFLQKDRQFSDEVARGNAIVETYDNMMTSANNKLQEIKENAADLGEKEMKLQVRRVADVMFDLEYGRKRAEASKYYKDIDKYALDNNIKIDFTDLIKKYINVSDDFRDKPLKEIFGSGTDFMNTVGVPMKKAFNKMASNALRDTYSVEAINAIKLKLTKNGYNVDSDLDLALHLADIQKAKINAGVKIKDANMLNFFQGTVSEAEDVMRYFRDKGLYSARVKGSDAKVLISDHIRIIDEALLKAGGEDLLERVKLARSNYSKIMGETTDTGYGFDVIQNRKSKAGGVTRKERDKLERDVEGNYKVRINSNRPEAVFYNIANLSEKFLKTNNATQKIDILNEIQDQRNRFMHFLGATMVKTPDGKKTYAFDLTKPKQAKIYEMAETILSLAVNRTLRGGLEQDAKKIKDIVAAGKKNEYSNFDSLAPENYNFVTSMNIHEIENRLVVPVYKGVKADGTPDIEYRKLLTVTDVEDLTVDLEKLLVTSQKARKEYDDLRNEIMNKKSATRIAAQKMFDDETRVIQKLEKISDVAKDPKQFFKQHFENKTVEDIDDFVDDLVAQGMTRDAAERSLRYMYLRGMFEVSGEVKTFNNKAAWETSPIRSEITDVQKFVDTVLEGQTQGVMQRVLGHDSKHVEFLEAMASWVTHAGGNPRGFGARTDTKGMSIDNVFSRVFNLARGMVSPLYVGTEIATRLLLEKNQTLLSVALKDRKSAEILAEILKNPNKVTKLQINTLGQRLKIYVSLAVIRGQGEIPTIAEFIGKEDAEKMGIDEDVIIQKQFEDTNVGIPFTKIGTTIPTSKLPSINIPIIKQDKFTKQEVN